MDLGYLATAAASDPLTCVLSAVTAVSIGYAALTRPRAATSGLPVRQAVFTSPDGGRTEAFTVEVARKPKDQRVGLMFRTRLEPRTGMAFVWRKPMRCAIWMRGTLVGLDVVFVSRTGRVLEVVTRRPRSLRLSGFRFRSAMVVELPAGTCASLGIGLAWTAVLGRS